MERGGFSDALNEIKTTATDAFLAEVRAQGVDAVIEAAKNLVAQEYEYKDSLCIPPPRKTLFC